MSDPTICAATRSAIFSPGSADGATPCASPGGPMTDLFGQVVAPVNLSARRASSVAATMNATYGLRSFASSESAALERSLASRLPELLGTPGGITWQQTWKGKATPQRRRILAHTASGLLTFGSGCIGWPTPNAGPQNDRDTTWQQRREALKRKHGNGNGFGMNLGQAATLASWATPQSRDHKGAMNPGNELTHNTRPLNEQVQLAAWATPLAADGRGSAGVGKQELPNQARGAHLNGSSAATAKPGQLNPAFSRWLMGFPPEWDDCAPTVTRSSRKSRRGS